MDHVRLDKWLWAARFFKTRTLSSRACEMGKVEANGQHAKAARDVRAGDLLQQLYSETEASREARFKLVAERKLMPRIEALREGKPSKRDRREIDKLRGRH